MVGNHPSESGAVNKNEPIPWRGLRVIDMLVACVLALLAAGTLALPFLDHVLLRRLTRLPGTRPAITWLANGNGAWIAGGALILLLVAFLAWRRHHIIGDKRLWYSTGCPNCQERELVRVSRHFGDRFYGLLLIPAYRYACRNCTWRGLRVARREHARELDAELEEALLRFDPDAALTGEAGGRPTPRAGAIFRDAGDVAGLMATPLPSPATPLETTVAVPDALLEDDDATPSETDELEWIWRTPGPNE